MTNLRHARGFFGIKIHSMLLKVSHGYLSAEQEECLSVCLGVYGRANNLLIESQDSVLSKLKSEKICIPILF